MERPTRPGFECEVYSNHLKKMITFHIAVPDKVYPMDLYNALLPLGITVVPHYGWFTSKARFVTDKEAAELALECDLLDKKVQFLTTEDFCGTWKMP